MMVNHMGDLLRAFLEIDDLEAFLPREAQVRGFDFHEESVPLAFLRDSEDGGGRMGSFIERMVFVRPKMLTAIGHCLFFGIISFARLANKLSYPIIHLLLHPGHERALGGLQRSEEHTSELQSPDH